MCTVSTANALAVRTTRADVGVVAEVLDRDVQRMPPLVDVGDDRLARPVPVGVDDVAAVAVAQQLGVVPRVVGQRDLPFLEPRPDAGRGAPFGRTGGSRSLRRPQGGVGADHRDRGVQQSLVDLALRAQRAAHGHRVQDASGRTSSDAPYTEHA